MPLDAKIAAMIQQKLERAHIPKAIQEKTGKHKFERIFRDKEELPISIDINDNLTQALQNSDFLIVICSPNTASSVWVQREITEFLKTHDKDRILTVLADGEPQDVIPEVLQYREFETAADDGTVTVTRIPTEPLSCDFRGGIKKQQEEFPRLMAAMLGCTYDDLRQRQRRRQRRQRTAALLTILALVTGIAVYALDRAARIQKEAENTQIAQSRYLSQISADLLQQGDRETAIQVALAALPGEADPDRPLVTEALYALNNATYAYRQAQFNDFVPAGTIYLDSGVWKQLLSPEGTRWMVLDYNDILHVYDLVSNREITSWSTKDFLELGNAQYPSMFAFLNESQVVLVVDNRFIGWDLDTNTHLWTEELTSGYYSGGAIVTDPQSETVHCVYSAYTNGLPTLLISTLNTAGDLTQTTIELPIDLSSTLEGLEISPDGTQLALITVTYTDDGIDRHIVLVDLDTQQIQLITPEQPGIHVMRYRSDQQLCVITSDFDAYASTKHCNYTVSCYDTTTAEAVWNHHGSQYILRTYDDYSTLYGILSFESLLVEEGGEVRDVLLAGFNNCVYILDPDTGELITYAEFAAEVLSIEYCSRDRVFIPLRNGHIVQYIPDSDLVADVGVIDAIIRNAAYLASHEKYALITTDGIIWLSSQLKDPDGTLLESEHEATGVYYISTEQTQVRVICEKNCEDTGLYRLCFYQVGDSKPYAQTDWFAGFPDYILMGGTEDPLTAYWIRDDGNEYLMGWDLTNNTALCDIQISNDTYSDIELIASRENYLYANWHGGIIRIDTTDMHGAAWENPGFLYGAVLTPDKQSIVLLHDDYDTDTLHLEVLDTANFPDAESQLLTEIAASISYSTTPACSPSSTRIACAAGEEFLVFDLTTMTQIGTIPVKCSNYGAAAFLNDTILAVCGDNGYLSTWDLTTGQMIMEDRYSFPTRTLIVQDGLLFTQAGYMHLYRIQSDGTFAREISVDYGLFSQDGTEVCMLNQSQVTFYPIYSVEELTAKAWELVDNQPLSETDQIKYFIAG